MKPMHPLCEQIRTLRRLCGLTLAEAEQLTGVTSLAMGSYERGERQPPLNKIDAILDGYGYKLIAVPHDTEPPRVHLPGDLSAQLRLIAEHVDKFGRLSGIGDDTSR